ncbi:bifunctional DNA primase/polymerase [Sorangium sp. So ce1024]|uniref:bifunctional DNA primase/polymerase n=1 Tax=Sorangium sp. So ce1024 TaxID=3133327 RepID=UPI003F115179
MSLLEVALSYAARGWPVLPVAWPVATGDAARCCCEPSASCARSACRRIGKHPAGRLVPRGVLQASTDPGVIVTWWRSAPQANIGIALGKHAGAFVVDVDPAAGGDRTLVELVRLHGPLGKTLHAFTGSGGDHWWFRWPGVHVPSVTGRLGPGVDVRGDGGYVVAPPSLHASGSRYAWEDPTAEVQPAPRWLLERVAPSARSRRSKPGGRPGQLAGPADAHRRAAAYLETLPPAVQGQGGSRATFLAALHLVKGFGLSPQAALALLEQLYNPRCQPPWSAKELHHKVASAERSQAPVGYLLRA